MVQDLQERVSTNMTEACAKVGPRTLVLTVHGTEDESVPVSNAGLYHNALAGSRLELLQGADHCFTDPEQRRKLLGFVVGFVRQKVDQSVL